MRFIHEIFLQTKFFVCSPIMILMSIKKASFQTEIIFKTVFKQRTICSLSLVLCVKDIKFYLYSLYFDFFLAKKASLLELSVLVISLSPKLKGITFPKFIKNRGYRLLHFQ